MMLTSPSHGTLLSRAWRKASSRMAGSYQFGAMFPRMLLQLIISIMQQTVDNWSPLSNCLFIFEYLQCVPVRRCVLAMYLVSPICSLYMPCHTCVHSPLLLRYWQLKTISGIPLHLPVGRGGYQKVSAVLTRWLFWDSRTYSVALQYLLFLFQLKAGIPSTTRFVCLPLFAFITQVDMHT